MILLVSQFILEFDSALCGVRSTESCTADLWSARILIDFNTCLDSALLMKDWPCHSSWECLRCCDYHFGIVTDQHFDTTVSYQNPPHYHQLVHLPQLPSKTSRSAHHSLLVLRRHCLGSCKGSSNLPQPAVGTAARSDPSAQMARSTALTVNDSDSKTYFLVPSSTYPSDSWDSY